MVFDRKTWKNHPDLSTPITAQELNRIEDGIKGLDDKMEGGVLRPRGILPNLVDLDNLVTRSTDSGSWMISTSNTYYNLPDNYPATNAGTLEVIFTESINAIVQRLTAGTRTWFRECINSLNAVGSRFYAWVEVANASEFENYFRKTNGTLPDGTDLDTYDNPSFSGSYVYSASNTYVNGPEDLNTSTAALFHVIGGSSISTVQMIVNHSDFYYREKRTSTSWGTWNKLVDLATMNATVPDLAADRMFRGTLPSGTDLNVVSFKVDGGNYNLPTGAVYSNLPEEITDGVITNAALLSFEPSGNRYAGTQTLTMGTRQWYRELFDSTADSWGAWSLVITPGNFSSHLNERLFRGVLPDGSDVDLISKIADAGNYCLATGSTHSNLPEEIAGGVITNAALLNFEPSGNRYAGTQTLTMGTRQWYRELLDSTADNWGAWSMVVTPNSLNTTLNERLFRGILPDGANINDISKTDSAGSYGLAIGRDYIGLPSIFTNGRVDNAAILTLTHSGSRYSVRQDLTVGTRSWYREVFDTLSETQVWGSWVQVTTSDILHRGVLPLQDLNLLAKPEHHGTYALASNRAYGNLPAGNLSSAGVLEVISSGSDFAARQLLSHGAYFYHRELNQIVDGVPTWSEWVRLSGSTYSYDPYASFNPSEILYVMDRNHVGNDFDLGLSNFSYTTPSLWGRDLDVAFPDGKGIQVEGGSREFAKFLWFASVTRAEALVRMSRSTLEGYSGGSVIRLTTQNEGYYSCISGGENPSLYILYFTASSVEVLAHISVSTIAVDQPFYIRFRAEGNVLRSKCWPVGSTEPKDWMVVTQDDRISSGTIGMGNLQGSGISRYNTIIVNSGGGRA